MPLFAQKRLKVGRLRLFFVKETKNIKIMCIFAIDQASYVVAGRVKNNIDGILRLRTSFVRTAEGKGRFRNVTVCVVKLRNFDSVHRGNATKRSRGCIISWLFVAIIIF